MPQQTQKWLGSCPRLGPASHSPFLCGVAAHNCGLERACLPALRAQSDSLVKTEIARNLRLGPNATAEEVAVARNAFIKARLQQDFLDGCVGARVGSSLQI